MKSRQQPIYLGNIVITSILCLQVCTAIRSTELNHVECA